MNGPLRPTAPIAPAIVLPDDPALALALAQRLLVEPRMANHSFGLWGYSGRTEAGMDLTVQSSGIGAASLVAVVEGLAAHGGRSIVRVGRCRAGARMPEPPSRLVAAGAIATDGASLALGGAGVVEADPDLTRSLVAHTEASSAIVAGADLHVADERGANATTTEAFDLETAALFTLARRLGIDAAAALVVSESAAGRRLEPERVDELLLGLGEAAGAALAQGEPRAAEGSEIEA